MVPVGSTISRNVIRGLEGPSPISSGARMTCAELETGSNSAAPWIGASKTICRYSSLVPQTISSTSLNSR